MNNRKKEILEQVLSECFWGDYHIDSVLAAEKLEKEDSDFEHLLVSRIVSDSPFPSARLIALFPKGKIRTLLNEITVSGRIIKRRDLAKAVIFNEKWEVEPSWIRI